MPQQPSGDMREHSGDMREPPVSCLLLPSSCAGGALRRRSPHSPRQEREWTQSLGKRECADRQSQAAVATARHALYMLLRAFFLLPATLRCVACFRVRCAALRCVALRCVALRCVACFRVLLMGSCGVSVGSAHSRFRTLGA